MSSVAALLRVVRWAAYAGLQERLALFTWRTWTFGWLLRLLTQVLFFALIGVLLASPERVHFLFVGNVAAVAALGTLAVAPDAAEERYLGTLPLLVAAPSSPVGVLTGKTLTWTVEATLTGSLAYFLLAPVLDHPVTLPRDLLVVALLAVVAYGCYGLGIFMASLVFRAVRLGNIAFNLVFWAIAAFCGVNVAVTFFPGWVQAIASVLPLTHGLAGLRALLAGDPAAIVLRGVGLEVAVGSAWLLLAVVSFRWLAEGGRRTGTLDFAE